MSIVFYFFRYNTFAEFSIMNIGEVRTCAHCDGIGTRYPSYIALQEAIVANQGAVSDRKSRLRE
jgi:hypothetical protein